VKQTATWRAAAVLAALVMGGVACSSDGDKKESQSTSTGQQAGSEVAEGLSKLNAQVAQIGLAASADAKVAKEQVPEIDKLWEPIKATVKEKDSRLHDRLDRGLATLKKAVEAEDFPQAQGAATDVAGAVKAYLAKFPG
jgi:hypothetical protein